MKYNFDEPVVRKNTNCIKHDALKSFLDVEDAIPMWVADMDFKVAPCIVDALKKRMEHEVFGYTIRDNHYFDSIKNWMQKRHDWTINNDWISFSPGVVTGFTLAIQQFTEPGDKIIIQPPVYFPFFNSIQDTGRILIENPLKEVNGRFSMDFEDLKNKISPDIKMLILCNPHNPGGMVWTESELLELNEICSANNVLVVSDEIHADIIYGSHKHTPYAKVSKDAEQNSITIMSPSKTFNVAGLTTSYLIIPNKTLLDQYNKGLQTAHLNMGNIFGTEALTAAYTKGEEWLNELLAYLKGNIELVTNFIAEELPQLRVIAPESTFLIWIDCTKLNWTPTQINEFFLRKAKVAINEGSLFGKQGEGFIRLNIGTQRKIVQQSLLQIKNAFSDIK